MKKLWIITDHQGKFLISLNEKLEYGSMDIKKLAAHFSSNGFEVKTAAFHELDLDQDFTGHFILYQTSEKTGQYYKKYIEDIIYYLDLKGAVILPGYKYLKAHHNKGFMELLRMSFSDSSLKTIASRYYGSPVEAMMGGHDLPVVIKKISGAGSSGVYRAKSPDKYRKLTAKAGRLVIANSYFGLVSDLCKNLVKRILSLVDKKYKSNIHRYVDQPFIVQNFISSMDGDYKVLYFGGKYYTLYRKNRENDFRASGSGHLFDVPAEESAPLLDFASKVVKEIDFPIIGMDIGYDGARYHLIEFQMIHVGPYALQKSNRYFIYKDDRWKCIEGVSDLEAEFARSICEFISKKYKWIESERYGKVVANCR